MKVNEIFYSLQGEGRFAGTPAVFVRFAGCNLRCPFCDTNFSASIEMSEDEIVEAVLQYKCHHVVVTGGEPSLQLTESLVKKLRDKRIFVQVETNGTHQLPYNVDYITCSPKFDFVDNAKVVLGYCNELKVVMDDKTDEQTFVEKYEKILSASRYVQPCDTGDPERNAVIIDKVVKFLLSHPAWKLSLQTHKIINIR